ncbi:hypothetical protein BD779DRAFT_290253 [Infundibulicybe gibba]|nr:hypothetical protein BD779DRAFT_290253 [Infundibulicybe gibba]
MAPYFGPQESASEVTLERYYLATDFVSGIGYGAQGVLYFICTRYLWTQRKARRMNLFMVWRCWVVWYSVSRRVAYAVAFLPTLMLIGSLISATLYFFALAHPNSIVAGTHTAAWTLAYYTLMLGTNVITTAIILTRLIMHRREMRRTLTHTGEYTSLISMLIESAAFYSIIGATCVIVSGLGNPVGEPLMGATISAQQISGYLIIARLAHGRGWQTSTVPVSSKIVIRRNASASDTQADEDGEGSNSVSIH